MRTAAPSLITALAITMIAASNANGEIAWQSNLRAAHAQAQGEGKLLLLHFYSDNCTWCEKLEEGSFKAPQVGQAITQNFVPVKIHANTSPKLAEMFKVNKFPTDVIVTTHGQTLAHSVSPQNPDRYVAMLSSTLPGLAAAQQEATKIASQPATKWRASAPQSVPGYAVTAAPSPAPVSSPTSNTPSPELSLPTQGLTGGAKAQFAGVRSDGLNLEMPDQIAPEPPMNVAVPAPVASALPKNVPAEKAEFEPATVEQPELAMQGFCPVTVINDDKWVEGRPDFGVIHLGKLYLFTSQEHMNTFLADPVPFTPVLNEIDVVRFFEERKIVPGKREWGLKDPIHNRMFFFADEAAMEHFYNEYERYTDAAIKVMEKAVKDANPGT